VQKIYDSIGRGVTLAQAPAATAAAIPLRQAGAPPTAAASASMPAPASAQSVAAAQPTTAASRISMRVVPLGASTQPVTAPATIAAPVVLPVTAAAAATDVFVPQIRHPVAGNVPAAAAQAAPTNHPAGDGAFVF
jgi:hypothetical protein